MSGGSTWLVGRWRALIGAFVVALAIGGCGGSDPSPSGLAESATESDDVGEGTDAGDGGSGDDGSTSESASESDGSGSNDATGADDAATGAENRDGSATAVAGAPADLDAWLALLAELQGPVASVADPFVTAVGYYPDDVATPSDIDLVLVGIELGAEERLIEDILSADGLDRVQLDAVFETTATLAELEQWYDSAYGASDPWLLDGKETTETDDGTTRISYQFLRADDPDVGSENHVVIVTDDAGSVTIDLRYHRRDVPTMEPFDRLSTIAADLPRPLGFGPYLYRLAADSDATSVNPTWELPGSADDAANDLIAQLPSGRYRLTEDAAIDGSGDYSIPVGCDDALFCSSRVVERALGVVNVTWHLAFDASQG